MLPTPVRLTSLDIYRDGGSLSASFLTEDNVEHTLFIRVKPIASTEQQNEVREYHAPVLEKFVDVERVSRISGKTTIDVRQVATPLSWEAARRLLEELTRLAPDFASEYSWVLEKMTALAMSEGVDNQPG